MPHHSKSVLIISLDDPAKGGGVGGKHTHIRLLARGLAAQSHSAEVVAPRPTSSFKYIHLYPGAIVRRLLRSRDAKYAHYSGQFAAELGRVLAKAQKPDFANPQDVIAMSELLEVHPEWAKSVPTILTLHGYFTREATSDGELKEGSPQHKHFLEIEKKVYRSAWRIVCVDTRIRDYVVSVEKVEARRLMVLPNAVDTEAFLPTTEARRASSRQALAIPEDGLVILCPRRLVAKNGVTFAVKAMALVKNTKPMARLILAGDGPQRAEIEGLIRAEGLQDNVRLEGSVPHNRIAQFYDASDIVLIPSAQVAGVEEATSLSMLEGMASGKPVVVTNVGGLKETVQNGVTGVVVEQANPDAIAKAIMDLSRDPEFADRLGSSARKYVEAHHSYLEHAKNMMEQYEEAARTGPP